MTLNDQLAAVVWAPHMDHAQKYASSLNARFYAIHYLAHQRPIVAPFKYILQAIKTWSVLARQKPSVVYVVNPPPVAALCVFVYCRLAGIEYVMDTHSPTLYGPKWAWTVPLQRYLAKRALANIVDQERFKRLFESWGARAILLEKPTETSFKREDRPAVRERYGITYVNTFAGDEPIDVILEAAPLVPDVHFYITGDRKRAKPHYLQNTPENVIFTDYLYFDDYWNQLNASRGVMVLTVREYSLAAGAQDAMSIGKPLLLSNQPALTEYFEKGAIFVDHTVESIVSGVREFQRREAELQREIVALHEEKRQRWNANFKILTSLIDEAVARAHSS